MQTLREVERKSVGDESGSVDEPPEDRSPTPESHDSQPPDSEENSLPSSPSSPPSYIGADGNAYTEGTLNLMATAPYHLRKSSDDLVLEEFFGSEQMTKLDMFKKQISAENLLAETKGTLPGDLPQIAEEGLRPGVSMPNISSNPPSSSDLYPDTRRNGSHAKLRVAKNRLSDANRMSYDVASEMEKLRARLQETAKQELAEFDRKYSPKLYHAKVISEESANNHSRQGSLDSSIPQQVVSPSVEAIKSHGHSRQHSLPIDHKFLRQLQQTQSNETTPTLATHKNGRSPSLGTRVSAADRAVQSPTPPLLFGHIRQVSGGSMSSEGGAFSPPLTPNQPLPSDGYPQNHSPFSASRVPAPRSGGNSGGAALPTQLHKLASNPPGMTRIASDGGYSYNRGSSNSLSRASPEGDGGRPRASTNVQPHYSTAVVKRGGKRGSLEITPPPQPQHSSTGLYRYEERVPNGRPNAYEQPKRRSYGEDMETNFHRPGNGGIGRYPQISPPRMEGGVPASPKLSRVPERHGDNRQQQRQSTAPKLQTRSSEPARMTSQSSQEDIQPYMTSKHVKSQMMQNFNYTPFTQHQQRSYTVSSADAPKLTKQTKQTTSTKSAKNTWI